MLTVKPKNKIAHKMLLVTAGFSASQLSPVYAAPDGEFSNALEVVMVTARRVQESAQDVPVALTAVQGEDFGYKNVVTMENALRFSPNTTFTQNQVGSDAYVPMIRGQRQGSGAITVDGSVGLYVDEVNRPRIFGMGGALIDVNRVEVLRGPQGTLYGRNTTGGAISVFSNDPTDSLGGSVKLELGNYDTLGLTGIANIPLGDNTALRLVGYAREHDGYGEDFDGRDLMGQDEKYVRGVIKSQISTTFSARLGVAYAENDADGSIIRANSLVNPQLAIVTATEFGITLPEALEAWDTILSDDDAYQTYGTAPSKAESDGVHASLILDGELSDTLSFRSITGYNDTNRETGFDFDGTPTTILQGTLNAETDFWSQELQLLGAHNSFDWVAGLYYGSEEGESLETALAVPLFNSNNPVVYDTEATNDTAAVYGQGNWHFSDQWTLTGGLRYTWDDREWKNDNRVGPDAGCSVVAPGEPIVDPEDPGTSLCPQSFDEQWSDPTWLISVRYTPSDDVMTYAKIAHGYRTGGFNARGGDNELTIKPFDPEYATEYEIGAKTDLFDGIARLNTAVFYQDYEDIQRQNLIPTSVGQVTTIITNAAEATIWGVELEGTLVLGDFLINAAVGYVDAEYDEWLNEVSPGEIVDRSGQEFGSVPEWTVAIGAQYDHSFDYGDMVLRVDYQWQDEMNISPGNETGSQIQDDYGLLNATATFTIYRWNVDITVYGRNLTDEDYFTAGGDFSDSFGYTNTYTSSTPRTYGVTFTKRFGDF